MADADRFWDKVMPVPWSGCWLWMGAIVASGYGHFWVDGKSVRAHRYAYITKHGPIPDALVLDHKCRVRCCVNPDHLEAVTIGENIRRGDTGKTEAERTHCPQGHPYNAENTYFAKRASGMSRNCRVCQREGWHIRKILARERNRGPGEARAETEDADRCQSAKRASSGS